MLILRIGPAEVFAKQTSPEEASITALVNHSFVKTSAADSLDDVERAFEGYDAGELRAFLAETPHWVVGTRSAPLPSFRASSTSSVAHSGRSRRPQGYVDGDDWRFAKRNHRDQHTLAVNLVDALAAIHRKGVRPLPAPK